MLSASGTLPVPSILPEPSKLPVPPAAAPKPASGPTTPGPTEAELRERLELLRRKYEECLRNEAKGFILEAFELSRQISALENRLLRP